jgi:FecR protein
MTSRAAFFCFAALVLLFAEQLAISADQDEARVTRIFHDVQVLPAQATPRPAAIDDKVTNGTGLRTGTDSRSELTFLDLSITRLGENTIFSFNKAGREVQLDSGSILVYVPKDSGGARISARAVTVGVTGTTLIFDSKPDDYDRLIILEGHARFSLNDHPDQSIDVRAGQLLNVNAGAKKLPKPGRVDLSRIMKTHPLIKDFPPLPSLDLILAAEPGRHQKLPQPPAGGGNVSQGGPPPSYNPTGPPPAPQGGYSGPVPTPTPHRRPRPTPHPTARPKPTPTPSRPVYPGKPPRPTRPPPTRRPTPTPTPGQIIR